MADDMLAYSLYDNVVQRIVFATPTNRNGFHNHYFQLKMICSLAST